MNEKIQDQDKKETGSKHKKQQDYTAATKMQNY